MLRLSIVIPCLGNWDALETTLVAVLQNRPPKSEVVVIAGDTYADPYDLANEVRFAESRPGARLVELVNGGVAAARGDVVHVLACGAAVAEGWTEPAMRHFRDRQVAAVAPLVVDAARSTTILTGGCAWSPGGSWAAFAAGTSVESVVAADTKWVGPELVAGFYRRAVLAELGAFDASLAAEFAAVDLGLRLRERGHRGLLEAGSRVTTSADLLHRAGALAQGWQSERLFWRHPEPRRRLGRLAGHGAVLLTEVLQSLWRPRGAAKTLGRMLGALDARRARGCQLSPEMPSTTASFPAEHRIDAPHDYTTAPSGAKQRRAPINLCSRDRSL